MQYNTIVKQDKNKRNNDNKGDLMKLVSFQSIDAFKQLVNKGYLETDERFVDVKKMGPTYNWLIDKMNENITNEYSVKYPLWCWVKFKNGIYPPKHKGEPVNGFDVKITFNKARKDVFITDFRRYSFVLNNMYIPDNKLDMIAFEEELECYNITREELKAVVRKDQFLTQRMDKDFINTCQKIRASFDKCITDDSDVLQGCVWRIKLDEVEKIELLTDTDYTYGSFNYVRSNGKRFNWIEDYYSKLV